MADAPRRRWPRRIVFALAALAFLLYVAPMIVARTGLVQSNADKALADFDGKLTIGSLSLGWFSSVELHDVTVADAQGRTIASAPSIRTSKTLFQFLLNSSDLGTIVLENPKLELVCEKGTTNLETSLQKILEKPKDPQSKLPRVAIRATGAKLTLKDGDRNREWTYSNVVAVAELGAAPHVRLKIAEPDSLEIDLALGDAPSATIDANRFPIEPLTPLLARFEPGLELVGRLSGQIATGTSDGGTIIQGSLVIDDFSAASPRLDGERITLDKIELPVNATVRDSTITVQAAKLSCALGYVTFVGSVDTAKPLSELYQQAGVKSSLHVDLAKIATALPKTLNLQPGTAITAGSVEVHLESQATATGTKWTGIGKTTTLKGVREGRLLAWDQPIQFDFATRFDAKQNPDFESLHVTSDFANVNARGKLEAFTATGEIRLEELGKHLADFIDMSGMTLRGMAKLNVESPPGTSGLDIHGTVNFSNLAAANRDFQLAANGSLQWKLRDENKKLRFDGIAGKLDNVRFRGFGVNVDEPTVEVLPTAIDYDPATGAVTAPSLIFATQTVAAGIQNLSFGGRHVNFKSEINANLARIMTTLAMPPDTLGGIVRKGDVQVSTVNGQYKFVAKLPVENLRYGTAASPIWLEPTLIANVTGSYDPKTGNAAIDEARLIRPDGTTIDAKGSLTDVPTKMKVDLNGTFAYDLVKFEPQLKDLLGKSVKAAGKDSRPFHLKGTIDDLSLLVGDASVGWTSISAYGFDVGQSALNAKLENGVMTSNPIEARFATTGKVKLQPTLKLKTYDLDFQQGRVIEKATLTPAACAEALGFALPAIAKASVAEGTISFDLAEHRIPLMDVNRSTMKGKLTLHDVSVSAGPVISSVSELFKLNQPKLNLAKEQIVNVKVENGRVHHDNLNLSMAGVSVTTSGSVGFDGSISLTMTVPVPENLVGSALKNLPAVREAVAKKRLSITLTGTLSQPKLDAAAFRAAVDKFLKEVARDVAFGKLEDLLKPKK